MGGKEKIISLGEAVGGDYPSSPTQEDEELVSFLVMGVAQETFAMNIERVREVIRVTRITWVPGAQSSVRGVINLRGNIIAVLDLAELIGLQPGNGEANGDRRIIIVESGAVTVGLLVDSVSEVASISPAALEQTMPTLASGQQGLVVSQTTIRDRIAGVLDVDQVVEGALELQETH